MEILKEVEGPEGSENDEKAERSLKCKDRPVQGAQKQARIGKGRSKAGKGKGSARFTL